MLPHLYSEPEASPIPFGSGSARQGRSSEAFPSLQQKAARLGYGLISNHAFLDGNKRIGTHVMLVFLMLNGIELEYTQEELSDMILQAASGALGFEDMVTWIIEHQL